MPTRTNLHSESANRGGNPFSHTTAAFTPPNNSLLVAFIGIQAYSGRIADGSLGVSGGGLTWTRRFKSVDDAYIPGSNYDVTHEVWTAEVTTGASMQLTVGNSVNVVNAWTNISIVAYTGYDTGGWLVQSKSKGIIHTGSRFTGTSDSLTLDSAPSADNVVYASAFCNDEGANDGPITQGSDFTEIHDMTGSAGYGHAQTQDRAGSTSTTVGWQDLDNDASTSLWNYSLFAMEIKAAAAASLAPPPYRNQARRIAPLLGF